VPLQRSLGKVIMKMDFYITLHTKKYMHRKSGNLSLKSPNQYTQKLKSVHEQRHRDTVIHLKCGHKRRKRKTSMGVDAKKSVKRQVVSKRCQCEGKFRGSVKMCGIYRIPLFMHALLSGKRIVEISTPRHAR